MTLGKKSIHLTSKIHKKKEEKMKQEEKCLTYSESEQEKVENLSIPICKDCYEKCKCLSFEEIVNNRKNYVS